jgi:chromosome partitioning protein
VPANIIAIDNQKGGVGKTTTGANLGIRLAIDGMKVLLVDRDPQGSLCISLGNSQPDKLRVTLPTTIDKAMLDEAI